MLMRLEAQVCRDQDFDADLLRGVQQFTVLEQRPPALVGSGDFVIR